jgi:hypothetical protein
MTADSLLDAPGQQGELRLTEARQRVSSTLGTIQKII